MKKYFLLLVIIAFGVNACKNANQKEIGEVESLLSILNDTENALLSVDTSRVFAAKRQMAVDLAEFNNTHDTLTKKEAFIMDNYYSSKKQIYRLSSNYANYIGQINFSKTQLNNLKQDLKNGLITKEKFPTYYKTEQMAVMDINNQINKAINGLDVALEKLKLDRPEVLEIIAKKKQKAATNE